MTAIAIAGLLSYEQARCAFLSAIDWFAMVIVAGSIDVNGEFG
jgi:hypothetical protein